MLRPEPAAKASAGLATLTLYSKGSPTRNTRALPSSISRPHDERHKASTGLLSAVRYVLGKYRGRLIGSRVREE